MRLLLCLLGYALCAFWGYSRAGAIARQQACLEEWQMLFTRLRAQILGLGLSIPDALRELEGQHTFARRFAELYTCHPNGRLDVLWQQAAEESGMLELPGSVQRQNVMRWSQLLDTRQTEELSAAFDFLLGQLTDDVEQTRQTARIKTAMYRKVGLLGGAAIAIALL